MKIAYVMDEKYGWVPGFVLKECLEKRGHEVEFHGLREICPHPDKEEFVDKKPIELSFENVDVVFVMQSHYNVKIKSDYPVVYYHTEFLWYPSCENPDIILTPFPEMEFIFARYFPRHKARAKIISWFQYCHDPELIPECKKKDGIYWKGHVSADYDGTYQYRHIYSRRAKIVSDLYDLGIVTWLRNEYGREYLWEIATWDAGLVVDGQDSYFSPRPVEFLAAGVIPIIYIQDLQHKQYYESVGFRDRVNCWFFSEYSKVLEFCGLSKEEKEELRFNGKILFEKQFSYKVKLPILESLIKTANQLRVL